MVKVLNFQVLLQERIKERIKIKIRIRVKPDLNYYHLMKQIQKLILGSKIMKKNMEK